MVRVVVMVQVGREMRGQLIDIRRLSCSENFACKRENYLHGNWWTSAILYAKHSH